MTLLEQFTIAFGDTFKRVFGATAIEPTPEPQQRVIALQPMLDVVSDLLAQMNQQAMIVDPETGAQFPMDWDEYFTPLDLYFDDDNSLFLLVARKGALYRLPVIILADDVGNTQISFGELIQIPLNRSQNSFHIFRTENGDARWFAVAASAVLNRVNEIDSTKLYDNFIRRAQDTTIYPILSFYHHKNAIRFGQADWLARDGFLYLTAGTFDATPDGQRAIAALERGAGAWGAWGVSIGYYPIGEPELLEVAEGVQIPVFNDGFNDEISIVLERDAAAHFTQVGAQEVTRTMRKAEYDALVLMFGESRAQELATQIDGTNRTIEAEGLIARAQTAEPVAEMETTAQVETEVIARQVELDDDLVQQIAHAFTQSDAWQTMQTNLTELNETVREVVPALNANTTNLEAIQATVETRLAVLERDETTRQRVWQQDLPQPQTRYSYRPREQRMPQPVEGAVPSMELAAQATLAKMKTRQPQAQQ